MTTPHTLATRPGAAMPPNLTREQAQGRAAGLTVDSYDVRINLTDEYGRASEKTFGTTSTVRFHAKPADQPLWIDFVGDGVRTAVLNGNQLDVSGWSNATGLALPLDAGDHELVIEAVGLYTNTGEGLHRFTDPEDGSVYLYSQFETADAKRLFACFDQPDLKATFTFTVTAPLDWEVVTNGRPAGADTVPSDHGEPVRVHTFATTARLSTYVTALVAGPYHVERDSFEDIELGIFCRRPLAPYLDADRVFAETKQGFEFFHREFGARYPFGKYDQLFVPEFNAGAMENAAAVTFREEFIFRSRVTRYFYERRCETILHEMAHMWFGDLVTMRWWDDLWLNESFATWASTLAQVEATEYTSAWTTFATVEKSWAYVQDQLPSTHPIAADIVDLDAVEVNFDGITYAKGASVLKQLAAYVGYDSFRSGLKNYFSAHAFANATLQDLFAALEHASGRDLGAWSRAWLTTTGLNTLAADYTVDENGVFTSFAVLQTGAQPGAGELRPHRLAVGVYDDAGDDQAAGRDGAAKAGAAALSRVARAEFDLVGARTEVTELVGRPSGALVLVNDDDLTYCKVRLDQRSLAAAIARVGELADSLPRSLLFSAVWEMTRDGEMRARDFVAMVQRGLAAESEIGVLQRLLAQTLAAVSSYADPSWASLTGWPQVTEALLAVATSAEPGGDLQLAAVNALAGARLAPDLLTVLAGWWDESAPLAGLTVDTDLHWTLLGALVAHGRAGEADIDAAEAGDPTASGQRRAATIRALRPDPAVKRAVWERLTEDDGMANALQDSTIAGFFHPAQHHLLAPFVDRYFDMVDAVWSRRSIEVASKVVVGLYPRWSVDERTAALALAWESGEHPAQLRRLVSEGRAGTQRALRARAKDAAQA